MTAGDGTESTEKAHEIGFTCKESEYAALQLFLEVTGFMVYTPEEVHASYNLMYDCASSDTTHIAKGLDDLGFA